MPIINNIIPDDTGLPLSGGTILNQSGIVLNGDKQGRQPGGWHEVDGYKEALRRDDTVAVRYFRGPWGARKAFYDWCLGYSWNEGGAFFRREPPAQHPEFPWMYCTEVELVRGEGALTNNPTLPVPMIHYYDAARGRDDNSALVGVTYRNLEYEVRTDAEMALLSGEGVELHRYVTRLRDYAIQQIPLPRDSFRFADGTFEVVPETASVQLLPTQELTYLWHDVPDVPESAIAQCVGRVNAYPFDGARGAAYYPDETLLCQPPRVTRQRSPTGRVTWEVAYKFLYRPSGWNFFPKGGGFALVTSNGLVDGLRPYRGADLNSLFTPGPILQYQ